MIRTNWFCKSSLLLLLLGSALIPGLADDVQTSTVQHSGSSVVTPELKGLVFLPSVAALLPNGASTTGIVTTGIAMLDTQSFREQVKPYLGKSLSLAGLKEITKTVVTFYNAHNHPLVDAVVPEQDVQSGVIQIIVTEFRVGTIRAKGNRWFSSSIIEAPLTLHHGDTIDTSRILSALDAANSNPFRRVNLIYEPSQQPGYTDLVLQTQDRWPLRFYSGFDNSGTAATGHTHWNAGATWGNAFGLDQQLTYQFSSSSDLYLGSSRSPGQPGGPSFMSHGLVWSMPLSFGDSISVFGNLQRAVPNIGPDLGLVGLSSQASIRYNHALPRTRNFVESVQVGYDFKTTNNDLAFGGVSVLSNSVDIDQFPLSYSASLTDRWGVDSSATTLVYSPGSLTANNNARAFASSGIGQPSSHYFYLREDFTRLTKLPLGAVWSSRLLAQKSNAGLLYTEQIIAGGPELLRGYQPNSVMGEEGVILSNELRTPPFRQMGERNIGQLQFLGFWDYGALHSKEDGFGYGGNLTASSIGTGLRYSLRNNVNVKFDYGWQLRSLPGVPGGGHMANVGLILGN